jgi:hypothetical protein
MTDKTIKLVALFVLCLFSILGCTDSRTTVYSKSCSPSKPEIEYLGPLKNTSEVEYLGPLKGNKKDTAASAEDLCQEDCVPHIACFQVSKNGRDIMFWGDTTGGRISLLEKCTIRDAQNWTCEKNLDPAVFMVDGKLLGLTGFRQISFWEYWKLRIDHFLGNL